MGAGAAAARLGLGAEVCDGPVGVVRVHEEDVPRPRVEVEVEASGADLALGAEVDAADDDVAVATRCARRGGEPCGYGGSVDVATANALSATSWREYRTTPRDHEKRRPSTPGKASGQEATREVSVMWKVKLGHLDHEASSRLRSRSATS